MQRCIATGEGVGSRGAASVALEDGRAKRRGRANSDDGEPTRDKGRRMTRIKNESRTVCGR